MGIDLLELYRKVVGKEVEEENLSEEDLNFFSNKVILVTGAGGTIGSGIVKTLFEAPVKKIVALDIDDTRLNDLVVEAELYGFRNFSPVLGDIRDESLVSDLFKTETPDVVFHSAAYKHLHLLEKFPIEGVKTNILGTYNVMRASLETGTLKFINISTDKAVEPVSVLGRTKKITEILACSFNRMGKTSFTSVRFGNIFGSRGSVVEIFLSRVERGGPLPVTDPRMKRFFITLEDAVQELLHIAAMVKGGEIVVIDMGKPVKIIDLAEKIIRASGFEPYRDIDIVFTGSRTGEKLEEKLVGKSEEIAWESGKIKGIDCLRSGYSMDPGQFIEEVKDVLKGGDVSKIKEFLKKF